MAGPSTRSTGLAVAALIAITAGCGFWAGGESTQRGFFRQRMAAELVELTHLGGIRDRSGNVTLSEPLPVGVAQSGGPLWVTQEVSAAVEADEALTVQEGPHRVMAEVVGSPPAIAARLSLERRGWLLRGPRPLRIRTAPWVAVVAGIVGVFALRFVRRMGAALALAGLVAQAVLASMTWPPLVAPRGLADAWIEGPLGVAVRRLALSLPDEVFAVGVGVVVLCSILAAFDHRRSRNRGAALLAWGGLGTAGTLAWLEAATRVGGRAALTTLPGVLAAAGLVALFVAGWRRFVAERGAAS